MVVLEPEEAELFGDPEHLTSDAVIACEVSGRGACDILKSIAGSADPNEAGPETIRGKYGKDTIMNVLYVAKDEQNAAKASSFFFQLPHTALLEHATLVLLRPHTL